MSNQDSIAPAPELDEPPEQGAPEPEVSGPRQLGAFRPASANTNAMWTRAVQSMSDQVRRASGEEAPLTSLGRQEDGFDELDDVQEQGGTSVAEPFDDSLLGTVAPGQGGVPSGLQANAARGAAAAIQILGFDGDIGGLGQRANKSDHPHGNAIDLMTHNNIDDGWRMARWYHENRDALGVTYIIFNGQIASPRDNWAWRTYKHPGGRTDGTAMHHDHVHISFKGGQRAQGELSQPAQTANTGPAQQTAPSQPQRTVAPQRPTPLRGIR